jgi:myo-inositol 2-dehydrogenase/D-chiro-inositol 1-dehydrogenase
MKMKTKVNYGILGCGNHALQSHAIPTRDSNIFELTALCDVNYQNMEKFEKEFGNRVDKYISVDEFFSSDIDAVIISTPDEYHAKEVCKALAANKHVFVEKPLATTEEDLRLIEGCIKMAKDKGLVLTSCHPRRYDPPFMWLKDNNSRLVEQFGNVISFDFDFTYHKPSKQWKHKRGLLMDHINHEIDLLHFVLGYSAFQAKKLTDAYDRYHALLLREDGIIANFSGTRRLEEYIYDEFVNIRYERGELRLDAHTGEISIFDHDNRLKKVMYVKGTSYAERFEKTTLNFAKAILKKEENYLTDKDLYINTALSVMLTEDNEYKHDC